jgi:hypothetical protein
VGHEKWGVVGLIEPPFILLEALLDFKLSVRSGPVAFSVEAIVDPTNQTGIPTLFLSAYHSSHLCRRHAAEFFASPVIEARYPEAGSPAVWRFLLANVSRGLLDL